MSARSRQAVADALPPLFPDVFPGLGEQAPLDLPPLTQRTARQVADRLVSRDFDDWSAALARVGNCARPVRLRGESTTVDAATGELRAAYRSEAEPLGVTLVRCGNRRASECPSCSRLYAADVFHQIRAGIAGGKGVPASVADNPLVFATVTAPSFGRVHGRRDSGRRCHPHTAGPPRCNHGRAATCQAMHADDDPILGQPLCRDCYDYPSQVVWQWWAPALWRRFTIALRRLVAKTLGVPAGRVAEVATVQYAKVAEYQRRGLVHFHVLIRLDGPKTDAGFAPAPPTIDGPVLAQLVAQAAAAVRLPAPAVDADSRPLLLAFGRQLDVRPVPSGRRTDDPSGPLLPEQVAGYLAKYATKSATDTGAADTAHHRRIRATVRELASRSRTAFGTDEDDNPYARLEQWVHMLGFRGHFASKSRRYSITLGRLRRARRRAQALIAQSRADNRPLDLAAHEDDLLADDETTLVLGHWQYLGSGWATDGDTALALAAAARAREYDQWNAERRHSRTNPR